MLRQPASLPQGSIAPLTVPAIDALLRSGTQLSEADNFSAQPKSSKIRRRSVGIFFDLAN
jgi:hypothetical protein